MGKSRCRKDDIKICFWETSYDYGRLIRIDTGLKSLIFPTIIELGQKFKRFVYVRHRLIQLGVFLFTLSAQLSKRTSLLLTPLGLDLLPRKLCHLFGLKVYPKSRLFYNRIRYEYS
jgi:hypothetical protein